MVKRSTYVGKLKKIERKYKLKANGTVKFQSVESWCKEYCNKNFGKVDNPYQTWAEFLAHLTNDKLLVLDDDIYEIIENNKFHGRDIFTSNKTKDGIINYCVSYQSDTCEFEDALIEAIGNMKNND